MTRMQEQVAPFIKPDPKPKPRTYTRYRARFEPDMTNKGGYRTDLWRSRDDALTAIMTSLIEDGAIVVDEVAVIAKRETRYEEVEQR